MMKFYTTYYTKNGMGHKRDLLGTHSHMCPEDKPESHKHFIHRVYNPMQFIKQKISRQLWKTAIGMRFHYTLHCSFWRQELSQSQGVEKCPQSLQIWLGKTTNGSTGLKNLLKPWMCSLTFHSPTAAHGILAHRKRFCCWCVCSRDFKRETKGVSGTEKRGGSGRAGAWAAKWWQSCFLSATMFYLVRL